MLCQLYVEGIIRFIKANKIIHENRLNYLIIEQSSFWSLITCEDIVKKIKDDKQVFYWLTC